MCLDNNWYLQLDIRMKTLIQEVKLVTLKQKDTVLVFPIFYSTFLPIEH